MATSIGGRVPESQLVAKETDNQYTSTSPDTRCYQNIQLSSATAHLGDVHLTVESNDFSKEQKCRQVFKTSSYETHKDRNPKRVEGTCGWALGHSQFQRWRHTDETLLWISADPGCGKSVLAKALVDTDLKAEGQETVCYYFFFKDNDEQDNLTAALCALLHQLFIHQPHLTRHAFPAWEADGERLRYETQKLWTILCNAITDPAANPAICVLDALDECRDADRQRLIQHLCALHAETSTTASPPRFKFIVTSRPYDSVERWFRTAIESWSQIRLRGEDENEHIHQEINLVIEQQVTQLAEDLALSNDIRDQLQHQLLSMDHRTYLWLHLALDEIRQAYADSFDPHDVVIPSVSKSIQDAYERLLQKITHTQQPRARQVLLIIVGARRPLTITEMTLALGAARACQEDSNLIKPIDAGHLQRQIRHWCGLFVFIQHDKLFLIHQTAKEFLLTSFTPSINTWRSSFQASAVEKEMASICMTYLLLAQTHLNYGTQQSANGRPVYDSSDSDQWTDCSEHDDFEWDGFWQYSAEFWVLHAQEQEVFADSKLLAKALSLYDVTSPSFDWFRLMWKVQHPHRKVPIVQDLHAIAMNGHTKVLKELLRRQKVQLEARDRSGRTALRWAAMKGHIETTQVLLLAGVDVNAPGDEIGNALYAAAQEGHKQMVQVLLQAGADVNAQGGLYGNALQVASRKGPKEVVQLLLDEGAGINAQGGYYGSALQAASLEGPKKVVQLLLDKGANVNAQGGIYGNALQAASLEGPKEVVQLLLDEGADINAQGGYYGSALQAASSAGSKEVVQLLLDKGANVNAQGGRYGNALQAASLEGSKEVVQLLLDKGANVNARGGYYGSALQAASLEGSKEVVQLLLHKGANVDAQGGRYGNALQAASDWGHEKVVQLLLDSGARRRR